MRSATTIRVFFPIAILLGCKEKYVPALNLSAASYLVVEGYINSGTGATTISLTRTTKLTDAVSIVAATKANVRVEGKLNTSFQLTETTPGTYTNAQLNLNPADQYRLHITLAGKEYMSDYSAVRTTPGIDSVSWQIENGGVQVYVNTHDPLNKTTYYQYKYDETWEFHSKYSATLKYYTTPKLHVGYFDSATMNPDFSIYTCWKSGTSTNIILGTSEKLTQDVISMQPVTYIQPNSWQISVLYSINVKQYALSQQAFRFYEQLKKNTEQLGSIFDAQPSDNTGNIHCLTNPGEVVIGFVEVSQEKQKRIFISNAQVPNWRYSFDCPAEIKVGNTAVALQDYYPVYVPTNEADVSINLLVVNVADLVCVDCRIRGVNVKPAFWP